MSNINHISAKLGDYMLRGWVLTDKTCPKPGCNVPLMRSSKSVSPAIEFCVNCDETRPSGSQIPPNPTESAPIIGLSNLSNEQPSSSVSSDSQVSRPSTPATELSSALSSPTFAPPVETEQSLRRQRQSDTASAEIGKRLLKGWAMLADECPNPQCFGIPLVRSPKVGGGTDPRKECVICGTTYIEGVGADGPRLVLFSTSHDSHEHQTVPTSVSSGIVPGPRKTRDRTPEVDYLTLPHAAAAKGALTDHHSHLSSLRNASGDIAARTKPSQTSTVLALEAVARSLELTLHRLSEQLTALARGQSVLDLSAMSSTATTIREVTQALGLVKDLQKENRMVL